MSALKRLFLGRPLASEDAGHTLLPKFLALPVFASDALSSVSYATEEILHVLILAGSIGDPTRHLGKSLPIAAAVGLLMAIVIITYRKTVRAYPRGGSAYIVARENLGESAGLVAGAALLIDYINTVAVSMAAGAFALASLMPGLLDNRVGLALGFIAFVAMMNLRGVKESGSVFAVPTYAFLIAIYTMLTIGIYRCTVGECPQSHAEFETYVGHLSLFLLLRAFASGATALTGVEAIADGVPAFRGRRPTEQAKNAATTLGMLGIFAIPMFAGITFLANRMGAAPSPERSVLAQIAHATFDGGLGFIVVQIATATILVMAANTAFQDFPRLASIMAKDRYLPRQFINRGDRLVFSNGIVILAAVAGLLVIAFDANVTKLIQLYVLGVFTSFTLSQAGMVVYYRRRKPPEWRRDMFLAAAGTATTGLVFFIVLITKFTRGAYLVVIAASVLFVMFKTINRHYRSVSEQLRRPDGRPALGPSTGTRALVLVQHLDAATLRALGYAIAMRPLEVRALYVGNDPEGMREAWEARRLRVPLLTAKGTRDLVDPVREAIAEIRRDEDEFITIVVPEAYRRSGKRQAFRARRTLLLKASLLFDRRVVVTDVPTVGDVEAGDRGAITPTRVAAVVLVSAVHNATLRALEYARSLSPTDLRAVTFNVEPEDTDRVLRDWLANVDTIPLEAIDSPYREITKPLIAYARRLREGRPDLVVSIIVPEFVANRWWHHFLHNQTALAIKYTLQFEPGVVLTSVPFHLE
jgi:amino acid transporter